ncbi:MAG: GNAT family N-acetyltransferase [Saprospiraceae bacterium]
MFRFSCLPFDHLSPHELYEIMALRQEVFVVEQNCPYLDADGKDQFSWHLMARNESGKLLAYTRLLPKGVSYPDYVSIGRVVSSPAARGTGAGREIMRRSIQMCRHLFGPEPLKIGAQSYLLVFYQSLGFESTGENYLEDGIPHTKMVYREQASALAV